MTVGLSTYAFFWQWHSTAQHPLHLIDLVEKTAAFDVKLFQICDYPSIGYTGSHRARALHWSWARVDWDRTTCTGI